MDLFLIYIACPFNLFVYPLPVHYFICYSIILVLLCLVRQTSSSVFFFCFSSLKYLCPLCSSSDSPFKFVFGFMLSLKINLNWLWFFSFLYCSCLVCYQNFIFIKISWEIDFPLILSSARIYILALFVSWTAFGFWVVEV